ncbi:MAG: dihydrolipoyllysine-residue acetyltransferase, partial [Ramlibacter sp.]|nr:dihydrolipoyllysine-residue acetyltransferase [Ramlibacter sp.]
MATIEVKVPDIGDFDEVSVIEVLVKAGDVVKAEQSLVTVESDKASMEIPSSAAGTVKELKVKLGDKVKEGSVLIVLEADGAPATSAPTSAAPALTAATPTSTPPPPAPAPAPAPAPSPSGGGSQTVEIRVPDIGDFKDVAVIEILVKPGDAIKAEQSLITVESDKASMEIPSSTAGVLKELKVKIGDTVNVGDLIGMLEGSAGSSAGPDKPAVPAPVRAEPVEAPAAASASPQTTERTPPTAALPPHEPTAPVGNLPHASPSVRKFARELGVPLDEVKGTGPKSRITQEDIQAFTRAVMKGETTTKAVGAKPAAAGGSGEALGLLPWPKVDFAKFGPVERKDVGRIRKISGANLHRNWVMIPHVTNHDDADITDLEAFRVQLNKENEKSGVKLTMLAFLIKACVAALKKFPEFNASLDGDQLVYKQYFNIAFAADTPNGLVVPVIKDADKKGLVQISTEMGEL